MILVKALVKKVSGFIVRNPWILYIPFGFLPYIWVKDNSIVSGGDFGWPIRFETFFEYTRYVWDGSVGLGYSASRQLAFLYPFATWGLLLSKIGLSITNIQRLIFSFSFVMSGIGSYLLFKEIILKKTGSFVAGLIYMLSPYALVVGWVPVYGISFAFYCFMPLNLYLFIRFLNSRVQCEKFILMFLSVGLYMGTNYANPAFFIVFMTLLFSVFLFLFATGHIDKKRFRNALEYICVYILLNSFWLGPFVFDLTNQFASSSNANAGLISDSLTVWLNSPHLRDSLRMTGLWTIFTGDLGDKYYDWQQSALSAGYILFSYLAPLLIITSQIHNVGKKNKYKLIYITLFFLIVVFINSAGKYYVIENSIIPGTTYIVRLFRSVYLKLGFLLVIPSAIFFGYSTDFLDSWVAPKAIRRFVLLTTIFLILFFYGGPFFSGQIIKSKGRVLPSYNLTVPFEYFSLEKFDMEQGQEGRYLSLPLPKSYNLFLDWQTDGYNGADFIRTLLRHPVLFMNDGSLITGETVEAINSSDMKTLKKLLNIANVKFIINHKDVKYLAYDDYLTNKNFDPGKHSKRVMSTDKFDVFEIKDNDFLPKIYTPKSVKAISLENFHDELILSNIGNDVALVSDSSGDIPVLTDSQASSEAQFKKINVTKYLATLHTSKGSNLLVFSEKFDRGWGLYTSDSWERLFSSPVENNRNHLIVDGGINGWMVDTAKFCSANVSSCVVNADGTIDLSINIEYQPQRIFLVFLIISIVTLVSYSLFSLLYNRMNL